MEIWLLKKLEPIYRRYPRRTLPKSGSNGCATTDYGRQLMRDMMMTYDGDQARYARLGGHGFKIPAEAIQTDLPYQADGSPIFFSQLLVLLTFFGSHVILYYPYFYSRDRLRLPMLTPAASRKDDPL